jgi:hypothetical protein
MNIFLKRIIDAFDVRCYEEAAAVADPPAKGDDESANDDSAADGDNNDSDGSADDIENYRGSKTVNPDQRPLKEFNRTGKTKDQIDDLVSAMGDDIFLSDEAIAAIEKKKKEEKEKKAKEVSGDDKGSEDGKDIGKKESTDTDVDEFYKKSGITKDDFTALKPELQERIVSLYESKNAGADGEYEKLIAESVKKHDELKATINQLVDDPTISARIEELRTGKKYVATDLPEPTQKEVAALIELSSDPEAFREALLEFMVSKGEQVIKTERSVAEQKWQRKLLEKDALGILQQMMAKEPRLALKEKDLEKVVEGHPEYEKLHGEGGLINYLAKTMGYSLKQIKTKGAEKLLKEIAVEKGWDKERDQKIEKNGQKKLLLRLQEAAKNAQGLDLAKRSPATGPTGADKYDRKSLVSEIASGNMATFNELTEKAGEKGDSKMLSELREIYNQAVAEAKKQQEQGE